MRWPFWKRGEEDSGANTPGAAVSAYLDGEVTPAERAQIETELAAQPDLTSTLEAYREAKTLLQAMPEERPRRSFALTAEMVDAAEPARLPERVQAPKRTPFLLYAGQAAAGIGVLGLVVAGVSPMFSSSSNDGDFSSIAANKDGHEVGEIMSTTSGDAAGGSAPAAAPESFATAAGEPPVAEADDGTKEPLMAEDSTTPAAGTGETEDMQRNSELGNDASASSLEMTAAYDESSRPSDGNGPSGRQIAFIVFGMIAAAGGGVWLAVASRMRKQDGEPGTS